MRTTNNMVVFLDFDGVTHPHSKTCSLDTFLEEQLQSLEIALAEYDARVVVISSWRESISIEILQTFLGGLAPRVIDKTGDTPQSSKYKRQHLVQEWLAKVQHAGEWMAIDDSPASYGDLANHVYVPISSEGFLHDDIRRFHDFVSQLTDLNHRG